MQYFLVVLLINFIIISCQTMWLHYKIEYTTLYVDETDEILNGEQSNESQLKLMSSNFSGTVYYAVQGVSTFESVDQILKCDYSNESY